MCKSKSQLRAWANPDVYVLFSTAALIVVIVVIVSIIFPFLSGDAKPPIPDGMIRVFVTYPDEMNVTKFVVMNDESGEAILKVDSRSCDWVDVPDNWNEISFIISGVEYKGCKLDPSLTGGTIKCILEEENE